MSVFNNRVFGLVIVKSINSNYNADFTHQPRTLPDGIVYATDKALKYSVKNYLKDNYEVNDNNRIFYFKTLNENLNPLTLDETYKKHFQEYDIIKEKENEVIVRKVVLRNLLSCLDIRLFGATFAGETNISIHGPVQINHGVNKFPNNEIFSEQIMSPFRNPGDPDTTEKGMTTLGQQTKLREGHYVHHFSINPKNLEWCKVHLNTESDNKFEGLMNDDITKLKEALQRGVSYYDSAAKAGTDNELLLWIQLKEDSKIVLPVFTDLVKIQKSNNKIEINFEKIKSVLDNLKVNGNKMNEIEKIEVYYNPLNLEVKELPDYVTKFNIISGSEIEEEKGK